MEKYTKYEIARILGARALQIAMNAPLLMEIKKETLEELNYDPLKIAEMEFNAEVLPITVRRPMPQRAEVEGEEAKEEEEIEVIGEETKPVVEEKKEEKVEEAPAEVEEEEEPEVETAEEI